MLTQMRMGRKFTLLVVVMGVLLPLLIFYTMSSPAGSQDRGLKLIHKGQYYASRSNNTIVVENEAPATTPSQQAALAEHVWRTCQKQHLAPPARFNPSVFDHILVDDRYKMLYCYVPKVACTNWRRVMLVLSGKVRVKNVLDIKAGDVHGRYKRLIPALSDFSKSEIQYRLDNYFKFMFVREPFERLLSAWRNKFQSNMSSSLYFRKQFGRSIVRRFRASEEVSFKEQQKDTPEKVKVRFDEFLQYLVDPVRKEGLNEHWAKYHRLCRPCFVQYDFVGKYETINRDADHVLRSVHADHMVNFPKRSATYKHNSTSSYVEDYYKDIEPSLLRRVYRSYQADFELFRYALPEVLQSQFHADDVQ